MNATGGLMAVGGAFILGRLLFAGSNGKTLAGMLAGSQPAVPGNSTGAAAAGGSSGPFFPSTASGPLTGAHGPTFAADILRAIGAPANATNVGSVERWITAEGNLPGIDKFNPLDTTQPLPGSFPTNSVGVQSFPTWASGVNATAKTLENGYYPGILSSLRAGRGVNPANATIAQELDTWGTGADW